MDYSWASYMNREGQATARATQAWRLSPAAAAAHYNPHCPLVLVN